MPTQYVLMLLHVHKMIDAISMETDNRFVRGNDNREQVLESSLPKIFQECCLCYQSTNKH